MKRSSRLSTWIATLLALGASGCFSVRHQLPPNAYFGRLPGAAPAAPANFSAKAHKNWLVSGLIPYSRFNSGDLLRKRAPDGTARVENLSIETRFDVLDTIIWIVPGFFYGYYVWAPRSVGVAGTLVRETPAGE